MSQEQEYKNWLEYISDISLDRDGFKNAEDLGNLVDELHELVNKALRGEVCPVNVYNKDREEV
jgi:hypothetical protein